MSTTEKFEDYEVQKHEDGSLFELGRGAMGITYKALDTDLQCLVALKIINPSTIANADAEQRFLREARSAAQLRHPNIAAVYRLGKTEDGSHYYAMEFCEGETLQQIVDKNGPIDCKRALCFTIQVAKALALAEEHKLVHRDLKPSNLIITTRIDEGEVLKVIDFGLAKNTKSDDTTWSSLGTHGFIGTAHFASPEQIEEKSVDTRSDIYSLGATLWFMLLGRPPFVGSLARIMSQVLTSTPDFSLLAGSPERVVALVRRMMEKDADLRPQTARELLTELKACLEAIEHAETGATAGAPAPEPAAPSVPGSPPSSQAGGSHAGPAGSNGPEAQQPDAPQEEAAPEPPPAWAPSFLDLLRARSALAPAEALRLGESLASMLDAEDPAAPPQGALTIQSVTIHFQDDLPENAIRQKLREHVTEWPSFDLVIAPGEASSIPVMADPSEMATIVPGDTFVGDRVQQLAHLLYELLGGNAGGRYAPLASLGEGGNSHLRRATIVGSAAFPQAQDLVNALRSTSGGATNLPPISPVMPVVVPPPNRPVTVAPVTPATPAPPPKHPVAPVSTPVRPTPPAPPPLPGPIQRPYSPPAPSPSPTPPRFPARPKSSPALTVFLLICAVIGVLMTVAFYHAVKRHMNHRTSTDYTYTEPGNETVANSNIVPPPATPAVTFNQTVPVRFSVHDHLSPGQISEIVWLYLDDKNPPVGSITLNLQQPTGSFMVTAPSAGHHIVSAQTQTMTFDAKRGLRTLTGTGRWDADLRGGEQYNIECAPFGDGNTYQLQLVAK